MCKTIHADFVCALAAGSESYRSIRNSAVSLCGCSLTILGFLLMQNRPRISSRRALSAMMLEPHQTMPLITATKTGSYPRRVRASSTLVGGLGAKKH